MLRPKIESNNFFQNIENMKELHKILPLCIIGSGTHCQIRVLDEGVYQRHAEVEKRNRSYFIRTLNPKAKLTINNVNVIEAEIKTNDRIKIGSTKFIFTNFKESECNKIFLSSANKNWNAQLQTLENIALSESPTLIQGPSGSGKEILAQLLHDFSGRSLGPFISINCSALSEGLIESELFGHRKGSFTDASESRKGAFEAARGGSLFLDEIGDLPLALQPKLLRALENNEVRPLGSDGTVKTDVRIIAATHQNLQTKVSSNSFRQDLYFRLNILKISPPKLEKRMEDFESLIYYFCRKYKVKIGFNALLRLKEHTWPGNIRELKNFVIRAHVLIKNRPVCEKDLPLLLDLYQTNTHFDPHFSSFNTKEMTIKEVEKKMIANALILTFGNQRVAAKRLGIACSTLSDRIKHHGFDIKKLINNESQGAFMS